VAVVVGLAVPARRVLFLTVNGTKELNVDCRDDRAIVSVGWDEMGKRRGERRGKETTSSAPDHCNLL
jgi:hypothetical protein